MIVRFALFAAIYRNSILFLYFVNRIAKNYLFIFSLINLELQLNLKNGFYSPFNYISFLFYFI